MTRRRVDLRLLIPSGIAVAIALQVTAGPPDCFLDPPCTGTPEGEPCDAAGPDSTNGGCNSTPNVFGSIECGESVCGTNWAVGGDRDQDWYAFTVEEEGVFEVRLRAEADTTAFFAEMSPGGACPVVGIPQSLTGDPSFSGSCASETFVGAYVLPPGDYVLFVASGTSSGGFIGDGFPCPDGSTTNNAYEIEIAPSVIDPPPPPQDLNGDCMVDFADILIAVGLWGPCPTGDDGAARAPRQGGTCFLDPPCDGVPEGEVCNDAGPDVTNGGCNFTPSLFGSIEIDGPAICATHWAVQGTRDTDWFAFDVTETTAVEIEIRGEVEFDCWGTYSFIAQLSPGGVCPVIGIPDGTSAFSRACDTDNEFGQGYVLEPGDYVLWAGYGSPYCSGIWDGFPCADGTLHNNAYELQLRTPPPPPPPCPGDLNQNGAVDFGDLLSILGNWGPWCPGVPECP